jgi:hypothetical protein
MDRVVYVVPVSVPEIKEAEFPPTVTVIALAVF